MMRSTVAVRSASHRPLTPQYVSRQSVVCFTGAADGSMGFKTQARDGDKAAVACIVEIGQAITIALQ